MHILLDLLPYVKLCFVSIFNHICKGSDLLICFGASISKLLVGIIGLMNFYSVVVCTNLLIYISWSCLFSHQILVVNFMVYRCGTGGALLLKDKQLEF